MKKIVGNWKCNLDLIDVVDYFDFINMYSYDHTKLHIGLAVPTVWLFLAKSSTSNFRIYAQDVDYVPYGSYTSKLSYKHLLNIETNQTIIGHSETRLYSNNSDEEINKKVLKCLENNIEVILCIGEPLEVYQEHNVNQYLLNQLSRDTKGINLNTISKLTIAYEPIWAIGTNKTPTLLEIYDVIKLIKDFFVINYDFDVSVLYGGSVNISNVADLAKISNLDGFLIGTASINPKTFIEIIGATGWNVN